MDEHNLKEIVVLILVFILLCLYFFFGLCIIFKACGLKFILNRLWIQIYLELKHSSISVEPLLSEDENGQKMVLPFPYFFFVTETRA
jgi:hypothetical protein